MKQPNTRELVYFAHHFNSVVKLFARLSVYLSVSFC